MRLLRIPQPFAHPDFLYELKLDGFRSIAVVEHSGCRQFSRNGFELNSAALKAGIAHVIGARSAVLVGCERSIGLDRVYLYHVQNDPMNKSLIAYAMMLGLIGAALPSAQTANRVVSPLEETGNRKVAPHLALLDANGQTVRLTDYLGRVVLLDFWATTCAGCVEEIPIFIDVAKAHDRQKLAVIGVSEDIPYSDLSSPDAAWARVKPFVRDRRVPYTILMGDDMVVAAYAIKALPLTYLIDKQGRVAARYQGVVDHDNLLANIKALLAERR